MKFTKLSSNCWWLPPPPAFYTGANAAELNINGVSDYAASADQLTSVAQFSDVYPSWAYQALANLVETYGASPVTPTAPSVAIVP